MTLIPFPENLSLQKMFRPEDAFTGLGSDGLERNTRLLDQLNHDVRRFKVLNQLCASHAAQMNSFKLGKSKVRMIPLLNK